MRSKSIVNIKRGVADDITAGRFSYGAILAESYWRQDKSGAIIESQPTTAEILDAFFWPFRPSVNNCRVYIGRWFTNLLIELTTAPGGVHIERVVFKPDLNTPPTPPDFIKNECWRNFREHWSAND